MSDVGLDTTAGRKSQPSKQGRGCIAVLLAAAILAAGAVFVYVQGRSALERWLSDPPPDYAGEGRGSVVVEIKEGDTSSDIAEALVEHRVVKSEEAFNQAALNDERSRLIQAGFYRLPRQLPAETALQLLLNDRSRVGSLLTIPEGLRLTEIVAAIAADTRFKPAELRRVLRRPAALGLPAYAGGDPEGFLFPATYEVLPDTTEKSLLQAMVDRFVQAARDVRLQQRADAVDLSPAEVVTVASLIQSEARRPQDFPKVAAVIYNRLRIGEPLSLDSTVHYAVESSGEVFTTEQQRGIDSPYNTYVVAGLPPGPIAAPGEDALRAALKPADGDWIYFVTVNLDTGETRFATTAAEHETNRGLLAQWCTAHPGRC